MNFLFPQIDLVVDIPEGSLSTVSIECPELYQSILQDLWNQSNGNAGDCILSESDKQYSIAKDAVCIFNPFDTDVNNRKVINALYKQLNENAQAFFPAETAELFQSLFCYADAVIAGVPYDLQYDTTASADSVFHALDIRFRQLDGSLMDHFIDYLRTVSRILHTNICIAVNLKYYFSETELQQLCEYLAYDKIHLLVIESIHSKKLPDELCWIIDSDKCIIDLNQ